jgi:hypothetical protein
MSSRRAQESSCSSRCCSPQQHILAPTSSSTHSLWFPSLSYY